MGVKDATPNTEPDNKSSGYSSLNIEVCENVVAAIKKVEALGDRLYTMEASLDQVIETLTNIRYMRIPVSLDIIASEVVSAVGTITSKIAGELFRNLSKIVASRLEFILQQLMLLLMSGPNELLSIIAMPLAKARKAGVAESKYLKAARSDINKIIGIIRKWLKGFGGEVYYRKMKLALPYIVKAMDLIQGIIVELQNKDNAIFDKNNYERARSQIRQAITITIPESDLVQRLGIRKTLQSQQDKKKKVELAKLNKWYKNERTRIDNERANRINSSMKSGKAEPSVGEQVSTLQVDDISSAERAGKAISKIGQGYIDNGIMAAIDQEWENNIDILDSDFEVQKLAIDNDAITDTGPEFIEALGSNIQKISEEFNKDMVNINFLLLDFLDNMKDGFIQYKKCQLATSSTYKAIDLIKNIMREFIKMMRKTGNTAAKGAEASLEQSHDLLEAAANMFVGQTKKYEENRANATEMALMLTGGHMGLNMADDILTATITKSLIDLINADDLLEAEQDAYNAFRRRVELIPDWDGKLNVWGVNIASSATSPYVQLIADSTMLVAQLPLWLASGDQSKKAKATEETSKIKKEFSRMISHNRFVLNVLNSYTPYHSQRAGLLQKLLNGLGLEYLADIFFTTLSLSGLVKNLANGIFNESAHFLNCMQFHQDLHDEETRLVLEKARVNRAREDDAMNASESVSQTKFDSYADIDNFASEVESSDAENDNTEDHMAPDNVAKTGDGDPKDTIIEEIYINSSKEKGPKSIQTDINTKSEENKKELDKYRKA